MWDCRELVARLSRGCRELVARHFRLPQAFDLGADITVMFGASEPLGTAAAAACVCAIRLAAAEPHLPIRCAVAYGDCVAGAMGTRERVCLHTIGPLRIQATQLGLWF